MSGVESHKVISLSFLNLYFRSLLGRADNQEQQNGGWWKQLSLCPTVRMSQIWTAKLFEIHRHFWVIFLMHLSLSTAPWSSYRTVWVQSTAHLPMPSCWNCSLYQNTQYHLDTLKTSRAKNKKLNKSHACIIQATIDLISVFQLLWNLCVKLQLPETCDEVCDWESQLKNNNGKGFKGIWRKPEQ